MDYILAHDLGTSGDKATLFTTDGELVASAVESYPCRYFNDNWAEQDPADWYRAVCNSTRKLTADIDVSKIIGVSFSGHMMGLVLLDARGEVLRPAIIWADQRATAEQKVISEQIGDDRFYRVTGSRNTPTNSLHKLLWVKNNESVFSRVRCACNSKDYITFRLTGKLGTDYSDASGMGALDINSFDWAQDILRELDVEPGILPELHASTDLAGHVTSAASLETGLMEGTPVFFGCGDGIAASIGSGISQNGDAYCCLGSSAWIAYMDKKPLFDEQKRTFNLAGIKKGQVFPLGSMQAAGLSYTWMKEELCQYENEQARNTGLNVYNLINSQIASSPAGANGLIYLPYLLGERSPWWDDKARGAFLGLKREHTHPDMLRAVMEGVTMNLALIFKALRSNHDFTEMRLIGGGAKDILWQQMMADILGIRIMKPNYVEEACSMGAAVVAGIGAGVFADSAATSRFLHLESTCLPDEANHAVYQKILQRFESCCIRLQGLFD